MQLHPPRVCQIQVGPLGSSPLFKECELRAQRSPNPMSDVKKLDIQRLQVLLVPEALPSRAVNPCLSAPHCDR